MTTNRDRERVYKLFDDEIDGYLDGACDDDDRIRIVNAFTKAISDARAETIQELYKTGKYDFGNGSCINLFESGVFKDKLNQARAEERERCADLYLLLSDTVIDDGEIWEGEGYRKTRSYTPAEIAKAIRELGESDER